MSVPKALRDAGPVDGHGYVATVAEFGWCRLRSERRMARRTGLYMQKWCGDCHTHNRYRARLARMRTAYGRRTR